MIVLLWFGCRGVLLADLPTPTGEVPEPAADVPEGPPEGPIACTLEPAWERILCGDGVAAVADGRPHPNLPQAVVTGKTVYVCPGVHPANLTYDGLHLRSATGDPTSAILTGDGVRRIARGTDVLIEGLTFRDGGDGPYAQRDGSALLVEGDSTVRCSVFAGNRTEGGGGAILAEGDLTVEGSVFLDNEAEQGGGIRWGADYSAQLTIRDSYFGSNRAGQGAALLVENLSGHNTVRIERTYFEENQNDRNDEPMVRFAGDGAFDARFDDCSFVGETPAIGAPDARPDRYLLEVLHTTFEGPAGDW